MKTPAPKAGVFIDQLEEGFNLHSLGLTAGDGGDAEKSQQLSAAKPLKGQLDDYRSPCRRVV